jgi:hypothetical protein
MDSVSGGSRVHLLSAELCERGLPVPAARALCSKLILHWPLVERIGIGALIEQLVREGLGREAAEEMALLLWALERLAGGALHAEILAGLREAGFGEPAAWTAALDAARLHRRLGRRPTLARGRSFAPLWPPLLFALALAAATLFGTAL